MLMQATLITLSGELKIKYTDTEGGEVVGRSGGSISIEGEVAEILVDGSGMGDSDRSQMLEYVMYQFFTTPHAL